MSGYLGCDHTTVVYSRFHPLLEMALAVSKECLYFTAEKYWFIEKLNNLSKIRN